MERCPCCNARLRGLTVCQRCGSDLGKALVAEQGAQLWLRKALYYWQHEQAAQSLDALQHSLLLKQSKLAMLLRDQLIEQQCARILELLAQRQVLAAKTRLYTLRNLIPQHETLQQLQGFTDYLLARE
ncbi:hypothetical protein [Methylomarinum vadi]|uniref:hypothetical protein n=1 Tax=Methylomarinum vadi TaxID=438855 RepID=UPI00068FCA27|nr:hypothetical protein [Methylomarinum vadi]